ncbi:MAG: hypothetical protein WB116_11895 [Candidatus Dormiibacterota bacterium]
MWSRKRVGLAVVLAVLLVALASSALAVPDRVVAWATVLEAGVLAVAALFAWNQLREMREARVAQTRPYVITYIHPNPSAHTIIDFVIANVRKTVARDIKLTFAPELSESSGPAASFSGAHWAAFDSGLPTLAPGQQLSCLWANSLKVLAKDGVAPKQHRVTITYSGDIPAGSNYSDEYVLDVGAFSGLMKVAAKGTDDAVRVLESLRDSFKSWTETDGVRVYVEELLDHRERREHEIGESIQRHNEMVQRLAEKNETDSSQPTR